MHSIENQLYAVRVVRPCRIRGEEKKPGDEVSIPLEHAYSAVCSMRCEPVHPLPRQLFPA